MATVPASAHGLSTMKALALQMKGFNKQLATESVLNDCFEKLSDVVGVDAKGTTIPNAIFMKVSQPADGTHSMVIPLLKSLQEKAYMGDAEAILGNEENLRLKHLTVFYNEIKKSVAQFGWGINFNDLSYMNVYGRITDLFTRFYAELRGRRIREALLLTYAEELTKSPISKKQRFNPNMFVTNTNIGDMPSYDTTGAWLADSTATAGTYPAGTTFSDTSSEYVVESIGDALAAATSGFTDFGNAVMNVDDLLRLEYYVSHDLLLEPFMMDGQPTYIFTVPAITVNHLLNPSVTKSLGEVWKDTAALTKAEASIPLVLGRVGSLLLIKDSRYPTVTVGGADGAWTLKVGFQQPGRNDGRNHAAASSSNKVFAVGSVIGAGALVEWVASPLKYATESTEYGQLLGKGAHTCAGIQAAVFDEDTRADGTYQQNTSCAVFMAPPVL